MLTGKKTWVFDQAPVILSTGTVGGPFEAKGKIAADFDLLHSDLWLEKQSFEQAHQLLIEEACQQAIKKASITKEEIQFLLCGDLINQMTPTNFAANTLQIPYLGLFSACATSMEALALGASIVNANGAKYVLAGAGSHNAAVEKQFRYPTEYGGQKPPTAQWTVTGAGVALLSSSGDGPRVTSATIGKVIDMGLTDPFNMGGAMAPAAVDTIATHLQDRGIDSSYYDLIITGDLAEIGRAIAIDLAREKGIILDEKKFNDCGLLIYQNEQPTFAGASGAGCSAVVTFGHLVNQLKDKKINKLLIVATGALLSPLSVQQKQSIPCIAHAVSIENGGA